MRASMVEALKQDKDIEKVAVEEETNVVTFTWKK
jgi:hypothetical protein